MHVYKGMPNTAGDPMRTSNQTGIRRVGLFYGRLTRLGHARVSVFHRVGLNTLACEHAPDHRNTRQPLATRPSQGTGCDCARRGSRRGRAASTVTQREPFGVAHMASSLPSRCDAMSHMARDSGAVADGPARLVVQGLVMGDQGIEPGDDVRGRFGRVPSDVLPSDARPERGPEL